MYINNEKKGNPARTTMMKTKPPFLEMMMLLAFENKEGRKSEHDEFSILVMGNERALVCTLLGVCGKLLFSLFCFCVSRDSQSSNTKLICCKSHEADFNRDRIEKLTKRAFASTQDLS
jgi:hypothetical protein